MRVINIIMSVYNGERFLEEQIESIMGSTYSNFRLFIFDDCSTDSSFEIAQKYAKRYRHRVFAYRNEENMGSTVSFLSNLKKISDKINSVKESEIANSYVGKSGWLRRFRNRNRKNNSLKDKAFSLTTKAITSIKNGAVYLKGKAAGLAGFNGKNDSNVKKNPKRKIHEYYMFCDQDDIWLRDKLSVTLKKLVGVERRHGKHKPAMVYTDAILVDEKLNYLSRSFYKTNHMKGKKADLGKVLMENRSIGCTCMFNQALCDLVGNDYTGIRYHDWWIALIGVAFGNIRFLKTPTVMYRQHSANQVGQKKFKDYIASRLGDMKDNRRRLEETRVQAESFYHEYHGLLKKKQGKILRAFINLDVTTPLMRRITIVRYGFFKSGVIRNIGLLLTI